jgi:hypothetical protein
MNDALDFLWRQIEYSESPLMEPYEPSARTAFRHLKASGILQQAQSADRIVCPDCEHGHVERIVTLDYPIHGCRHAIPCPEHGRVFLRPEEIRQWDVSFRRLLELLVAALDLKGRVTEVESRRLWRLGTTLWQSRRRTVLFARGFDSGWLGLAPPNLSRYREAIVLVPHRDPSGVDWGDHAHTVVPLPCVATLVDDRIEIDVEAMASIVSAADRIAEEATEGMFSLKDLKLLISQQLKTVQRQELPDDILIQAYVQEGSLRKAAEFLTHESDRKVTKDKVKGAVQRAGGIAVVVRDDDTDSIVRNTSSQRRDRTGRRLHRSQR